MINEFMPDTTTIDIRENEDTIFQFVILLGDSDRQYQYEVTCDYVKKTNKVHWIVFKNDLYRYHGRYRVSLFNYPVETMDRAIELACNCVENHYTLNNPSY